MTRSDRDLLSAHLHGDRHAFAELVDRHLAVLWTVAVRTLGSRDDADEVLWEALRRAHQCAGQFRAESSVKTWLVQIVVNACIDRHRRNRTRPSIPVDSFELRQFPAPRDPIEEHELHLDIQDALLRLPTNQRVAIVLVDMHGYPPAEAAAMLRVPVGTVKSRCARGRARLAQMLEVLVREHAGEEW